MGGSSFDRRVVGLTMPRRVCSGESSARNTGKERKEGSPLLRNETKCGKEALKICWRRSSGCCQRRWILAGNEVASASRSAQLAFRRKLRALNHFGSPRFTHHNFYPFGSFLSQK